MPPFFNHLPEFQNICCLKIHRIRGLILIFFIKVNRVFTKVIRYMSPVGFRKLARELCCLKTFRFVSFSDTSPIQYKRDTTGEDPSAKSWFRSSLTAIWRGSLLWTRCLFILHKWNSRFRIWHQQVYYDLKISRHFNILPPIRLLFS